ncbi:MAG: protoporphyrinogen oxidase [Elusimicrobiota bacterium]|jgi:oxygen-dependent protoporphyrinogen oxidase
MRVLVIGGGITGLSCAYDLLKAQGASRPCCAGPASAAAAKGKDGLEVALLEASGRLGGKVLGDELLGVPLDAGPDSILSTRPWALELARELGLGEEVLSTERKVRHVYLYARGRLHLYPEGVMMLMPSKVLPFLRSDLMTMPAKLRMACEAFVRPMTPGREESMAAFARRRFGEAAVRSIVEPALAGIYAGDPEQLSLDSTFPMLRDYEQRFGSVLRGLYLGPRRPRPAPGAPTMFITFRRGIAQLSETLAERVRPCVRLNARVLALRREGGVWKAALERGETLEAERIVMAASADAAAPMLRDQDAALADALGGFEFSSTAAVNLLYAPSALERIPPGFGFLVERGAGAAGTPQDPAARAEGSTTAARVSLTAATFVSRKFPGRAPADKVLLRAYLGGRGREAPLGSDDETLLRTVRADLRTILGLEEAPLGAKVHRWTKANALYNVGHAGRVAAVERRAGAQEGLLFAGGCYRGIGVPECVRSGREAARRVLSTSGALTGAVV